MPLKKDPIPTTLSSDANRAPHCRPTFPTLPRGWCAPRPPHRRRGAERLCQRHRPGRYPAAPDRVENQPQPRRAARPGSPRVHAGAYSAPAARRSLCPVAELARASARPPSPPIRVHQLPGIFLNQGNVPFTPEAFPQLSPKACAVLNTPLKDCDPKTLDLVVSTFTQYVREVMSPEVATTDRAATLPHLWQRLSTALDDTKADASLPATPDAAPATPTDAVPDAPVLSPHPPTHAPQTEPTKPSTTIGAPRLPPPVPLSSPPTTDHPPDATITPTAPQTTPDITAPSGSVAHGSRSSPNSGRSSPFRCCRALLPRGARDRLQCLPTPWRLCHAACTGPP